MIDTYYRTPYQTLFVDPILPFLNSIPPNRVTLGALLTGLLVPLLLSTQAPFLALGMLLLSGYFDTLDGSLARKRGLASPLGCVLDIFTDRVVEFSVILGLYLFDPVNRGTLSILMLGSTLLCITSFLVVAIFNENQTQKGFHYSAGLIERGEAFALFAAMVLFPKMFWLLASVYSLLVLLTALIRIGQFCRSCKTK